MMSSHEGSPNVLFPRVETAMQGSFSVAVALCSTDLDKSVYFYFRNDCQTSTYRSSSTFLSVVPNTALFIYVLFF